MRHAVAGLLPHAAAPRECDQTAPDGAQLAAWLARHCEEAQQELSVLGVDTLTLFRGYHEPLDRRSPGVAEAVRAGLEQGALRVEDTDPWFPRIRGSCLAAPIVSTVDSWSTSRRDASYWADHRGQFSAVMVAEVKAWAVLSWSAHGLGDGLSTGHQEVLVIGGRGQVRWEFDSVVHPDLIPAASRQFAGRREPFDPGRR